MQHYGQEDAIANWQTTSENFGRLILLSMTIGLVAAFLWWSLMVGKGNNYALQYGYSWLYCHIPFGCSDTARSNLRLLQPQIEGLGQLWRQCTVIFAVGTVGAVVGLRHYFIRRSNKLLEEQYLRGAKLLAPDALNRAIDTERNHSDELRFPPSDLDLRLGIEQIRLPDSLTYRHLATVGASGTGKTQAIDSMIRQLQSYPHQKAIVLDLNGQYYSRFGRPGDKILSLYDPRSAPWTFYNEGVPPEFFAEALVELDRESGGKFFSAAGRALLTDIISLNSTVEGIWSDLTIGAANLLPKLQGGISPGLLGAPDQAAGVIATASVEFNFLRHLNRNAEPGDFFSIIDWATDPASEEWIFLICHDIDLPASKPLLRLWFDLAVGGALQRQERGDYPHLWAICDELPGLGQLPSLGKLLSQGRKYRSTVIAGYQVRGQIEHLYGEQGAQEIFTGLQNRLVFRVGEPDAAAKESLTLGEQDYVDIQIGDAPESLTSNKSSATRTIKTRPAVMASEIQNLPDLTCYIKLCHLDPALIHFDYQSQPEVNPPAVRFVPLLAPTTQPAAQRTMLTPIAIDGEPEFDP